MPMKLLTFVGQKNTGKTTIITRFITWLNSEGYKVGSVKFSPHSHALDVVGKDSYRHRKAGAGKSAFITPEGYACFEETPDINYSKQAVLSQFQDTDIIIIEGNLGLGGKKLEVFEYNTQNSKPYALENSSIHALLSSQNLNVPCPIIHPDDFPAILTYAETIS